MSWASVEAYIDRSRITGPLSDTVLRDVVPDGSPIGVAMMDLVKYRFDWSDHDLADALGISESLVSRYWLRGVPDRHLVRLGELSRLEKDQVPGPRRN